MSCRGERSRPNMAGGLVVNLVLALLTRLGLLLYGLWQDNTMLVKYTDVDYEVFTDAARFVTQGESPYRRATYRYTPVLAILLTPNIYITPVFGKLLFIFCDLLAGYLLYAIVHQRTAAEKTSLFCAQLWLHNPLSMTVSTRGNAESILASLVLCMLYCLTKKGRLYLLGAGVLYGLAVHMKIYPVTYALALYLFINSDYVGSTGKRGQFARRLGLDIWPSKERLIFCGASSMVFIGATVFCYQWYGMEFVQETYLYHVTRSDTRHNFSPYFYTLYLESGTSGGLSTLLGLVAFVPQMALLILTSFKFHRDLPLCCFLLTFLFVSFNKVCTSQYFLWYLSLVPLVVPLLSLSWQECVLLIVVWFVGQGVWLAPAYFLEFEGVNTFLYIWAAGLVFLCINVWILHRVIKACNYSPLFKDGRVSQLQSQEFPTLSDILSRTFARLKQR